MNITQPALFPIAGDDPSTAVGCPDCIAWPGESCNIRKTDQHALEVGIPASGPLGLYLDVDFVEDGVEVCGPVHLTRTTAHSTLDPAVFLLAAAFREEREGAPWDKPGAALGQADVELAKHILGRLLEI